MWEKELGEFAGRTAWRGDLPLDRNLPDTLRLDLSQVKTEIHPMFAIRLRVFSDWHRSQGRTVDLTAPSDPHARRQLEVLGAIEDAEADAEESEAKILPIAPLKEFNDVEKVAGQTRELLEYERPHLAHLGDATFMAIGELCNNAVEHGASRFPAYAAAAAQPDCPSNLTIAIADLGIGIPEHLRQAHPEWSDDSAAIARATYEGVSGTGDPQRGFGFHHIFDAILKASLHAAEIEIYSANGFLRTKFFDGRRIHEPSPPPQYRKGTSVVCRFVSADT